MVSNTLTNPLADMYTVFINRKNSYTKFFLMLVMFTTLSAISSQSFAVNITVKTSHNPVALDDSFHLVYEADSSVDDDPDFSPLEKYFDILNSSQSTNMRLINGQYSLKKSWDLVLIGRDIGNFTVPSISFGKDKSPSIRISITNSVTPNSTLPNGQATIPAKIFLESSIDKKAVRVQEQNIYSVRVLRTVGITGASLSEPKTSDADAIIQRLGEDSNYQTSRNGIRYDVIERRYVIYPQHSGRLTIKPVTFEGRVNATQPRTIFDQFRMSGQLKRLHSPAVHLNVKPKPANIHTRDWLPASQLKLVDDWSEDVNHVKTGEPVTRTVTIVAEGQTGALLPDLSFDDISNLKQYPDKAITTDQTKTNGITGAKQIKIALIPAQPGDYVLPEIKLPWWNTRTHKAEIATLPAITLHVTGAASLPPQPATPAQTPPLITMNTPPAVTTGATMAENNFWKWLSIALATGWIITLFFIFFTRGTQKQQAVKTGKAAPSLAPLEKTVLKACKQNQPEAIKNALLAWAQAHWPEEHISNLSRLAQHGTPELKQEIEALNQALYDPAIQHSGLPATHTKALATAFIQFKTEQKKRKKQGDPVLEPLYKN